VDAETLDRFARLAISSIAVTFHIVPPSAKLECLDQLRPAAYLIDIFEVFSLNLRS
jgi:hypothetical protein